jgi:hypothetical protein
MGVAFAEGHYLPYNIATSFWNFISGTIADMAVYHISPLLLPSIISSVIPPLREFRMQRFTAYSLIRCFALPFSAICSFTDAFLLGVQDTPTLGHLQEVSTLSYAVATKMLAAETAETLQVFQCLSPTSPVIYPPGCCRRSSLITSRCCKPVLVYQPVPRESAESDGTATISISSVVVCQRHQFACQCLTTIGLLQPLASLPRLDILPLSVLWFRSLYV